MCSFHSINIKAFTAVLSVLFVCLWGSPPVQANALRNTIYDVQIRKWNAVYNPSIPYTWAKAQLVAESRLNTNATSPVGAMGLGQFMPDTWAQMTKELKLGNVSAYASSYNIQAHAYYMAYLRSQFKAKRPEYDKHSLALASYNAGIGNIVKAQAKGGNSLLYAPMIKALPQVTGKHSKETTDYVNRIWDYVGILEK